MDTHFLSIKKIGENVLVYTGLYGPLILFLLSLYILRHKRIFFVYYSFGFFVNMLINYVLKGLIKQPRPKEDIHVPNIIPTNGKRYGYDTYGMPSGHAQMSFYSITFIYLVLTNNFKHFKWSWILFLFLLIGIITLFQRILYKNHTLLQVLVGSLLGIIIASIFYKGGAKVER
jgi:membrane-associated phospholipid phosphatase